MKPIPTDPNAIVARQVERLMTAQGLDISKLARACGWDRSVIRKLLAGERDPRWDEVVTLALVLGVPVLALVLPQDGDGAALAVSRSGETIILDGGRSETPASVAFAWMAGVFSPELMLLVNPLTWLSALPESVRVRFRDDLTELARDAGYTVSEDGHERATPVSIPRELRTAEVERLSAAIADGRERLRREYASRRKLTAEEQREREALRAEVRDLEQRALAAAKRTTNTAKGKGKR